MVTEPYHWLCWLFKFRFCSPTDLKPQFLLKPWCLSSVRGLKEKEIFLIPHPFPQMRTLLCVYMTMGYDRLIWPLFSLFSFRCSGWKSHGLCPRLNYRHNWYTIQPGLLRVWHLFSFFLSCGSATGEDYHYGQWHCQVRYCIWFSEWHGACAQEEKRRFPSTPREQSINSFMFRKAWI